MPTQLLSIINNKKQRDDNFADSENMSINKDTNSDKVEPKYKSTVLLSLYLQPYGQPCTSKEK